MLEKITEVDIEALLATFTPSDEPFEIRLPTGDVLSFRAITDLDALDQFYAAAAQWYAALPEEGSDAAKIRKLTGLLPRSSASAIVAYMLAELSVKPKITHIQALRMLKAPWLARHLSDAIGAHMKNVASMWELARLKESKKNLLTKDGNGSGSSSRPMSSTSTRTRSTRKRKAT